MSQQKSVMEMVIASKVSGAQLGVVTAYKSWAYWCSQSGACFQVAQIRNLKDALSRVQIVHCLAETLTRATMEVAIGLEYDKADTCSDHHVMIHIYEMFGEEILFSVRTEVASVDIAPGVKAPLRALRPDLFREMGDNDFADELERMAKGKLGESG